MNLENTQTLKNLARAYATETHDGARYQFLREAATKQKLHYIANTLKMLATNEMAHARVWWDLITDEDKISFKNIDLKAGFSYLTGTFVEQFKIVTDIEKEEGENIYLNFAKKARLEGFEEIAKKFELAAAVERKHSDILQQLYDGLTKNSLYVSETPILWKCSKCGHEDTSKKAWRVCPLCDEPQGYAEANIKI